MPTRRKPGRSSTARWAGLASHWLTTQEALIGPQARSSPNTGPAAPEDRTRDVNAPWEKYCRCSMSEECARATRTRRKSTRRGARPWLVRVPFITLSREFSEEVSPPAEAVAAAPNTSKPVRKATRTFVVFNIRGSVEKAPDVAYPPKGGYTRPVVPANSVNGRFGQGRFRPVS